MEEKETVKEFPAMRLDGGILRCADTFFSVGQRSVGQE